ncbi:hypothetical protein Tco_0892114 [Tanacetum coccineum]|uniref:Uncharacterized protein n=1 Tax=Tanacetum coccineum TaxID=301880 RepID=A0ABQ5C6T5_9ASTR
MDSIILNRQKNTLAENMILSGADNHPPLLEKDLYDSWQSRMELYMENREHANQQTHLAEFLQIDSGLADPMFKQGDDPIDAINKMMSFLSTVVITPLNLQRSRIQHWGATS